MTRHLLRRDLLLAPFAPASTGIMIGQPQAAEAGLKIMAEGGNAVDAAVTGALVAGTVALLSCGIAGYGGHMVIAMRNGKVRVIDFNTVAPADPPDRVHQYGWLSVGVPATLAGLDLAVKRYGTRQFRNCLQPALRFAREGWQLPEAMGKSIHNMWVPYFSKDEGAAKLLGRSGKPLGAGDHFRNPDLAAVLEELAKADSCEPFYRGAMARRIADEFRKHGGKVTAADLAAYHAQELEPVELRLGEYRLFTAPLTAGGATTFQAMKAYARLHGKSGADDPATAHARLEALRIAWRDRLELFGDPKLVKNPVPRLMSDSTADRSAARIREAVSAKRALDISTKPIEAGGTTHLSVADKDGNVVAVTLTHGDGFGSRVVVPGHGLILGHGLSRFDPTPGHANGLAPRKQPLDNMCPTVVLRNGRPVAAVGATGGRRIPNALFDVLARMMFDKASLRDAVAAPRLNTTGGMDLAVTHPYPPALREYFTKLGFQVKEEGAAVIQAVAIEPERIAANG